MTYQDLPVRVDRGRPPTEPGRMFAALCELRTLPPHLDRVDAILIRPGMGEMNRWRQAVEALRPNQKLLVAGASRGEKETWRPTPDILRELGVNPNDDRVHFQPTASHTKEQSVWIVTMIQKLQIHSLAHSVSLYHLVRSYMTDLATLHDFGLNSTVAMFPFPTNDSPLEVIPQTGLTMGDSYQGEFERIGEYMAEGHVATWSQLYDYLLNTVLPMRQSFR